MHFGDPVCPWAVRVFEQHARIHNRNGAARLSTTQKKRPLQFTASLSRQTHQRAWRSLTLAAETE
jgi:hypothetical protein